jgi:uncharacterized protein involved in exopolysaccharide biosynthesis
MGHNREHHRSEEPDRVSQPEAIAPVAWRRKGWLLAGLLLGLGASAAVSMGLPPAYRSTAQISILRKYPEAITNPHPLATDAIAPPAEVLRSPAVIDNAVRSRNLGALGIFAREDGDLVLHIRAALTVVPTKVPAGQGNLFRLSYRDGDRKDCQTVLGAILESYRAHLEEKHTAAAGEAIELILREQEKVRKELARQESDYLAFREKAPLLGKARDGLELKQQGLSSIQAKRSALLLQKVEVEGQLAAVDRALKAGRSQDAVLVMLAEFALRGEAAERDPHAAARLQEQLLPLLVEERRLLQLHGRRHPEVRAVRERIAAARRLLLLPLAAWKAAPSGGPNGPPPDEDPVKAHVDVLRHKLEQLKIAERLLAAAFQKEQDEARRLAIYEIRNEAFQSNIALSRQLYEALVKRVNDSSLVKGAGGYRVEVVEPPSAARRVSPNYPLNLAAGTFLGLLAGLLLAMWVDGRAESGRGQRLAGSGPLHGSGPRSVRPRDDESPVPEQPPEQNDNPPTEVLTPGLASVPASPH